MSCQAFPYTWADMGPSWSVSCVRVYMCVFARATRLVASTISLAVFLKEVAVDNSSPSSRIGQFLPCEMRALGQRRAADSHTKLGIALSCGWEANKDHTCASQVDPPCVLQFLPMEHCKTAGFIQVGSKAR